MGHRQIRRHCVPDAEGQELLRKAITELGLSARAYDRALKVSRTIADLEGAEAIAPDHVSEAIQYRALDRQPGSPDPPSQVPPTHPPAAACNRDAPSSGLSTS